MSTKKIKNLLLFCGVLQFLSCTNNSTIPHEGSVTKNMSVVITDSVELEMDSTSSNGNFFFWNNTLCFADTYYNKVYRFNLSNGNLVSEMFGKGQAVNEISSFVDMYPIKNNDDEVFFIDSSNGLYTFTDSTKIERRGIIDFGWGAKSDDYESTSLYNIMEMSDFGFKLTQTDDSTLMVPLSIVNRLIKGSGKDQFEKGHIFGSLNLNTMKIDSVFGHYPQIYTTCPTNLFDFFSYDTAGDTVYVSHCIDSLIYVYKYPDELLYTMGYECPQIDRNYTKGHDIDFTVFEKDAEHVGVNTMLFYVKETGMLLRTMWAGGTFGNKYYLQAYKNNNLVAEAEVPMHFTCMYYNKGVYYAVNAYPHEKNGKEIFMLYKFVIK